MSESGDYTPAPWAASHNFASAKKAYLADAGRAYTAAVSAGVSAADLVPASINCEAEHPLILVVDGTGSMQTWPATIFSKFPYLEHEAKEYLGDDVEFSFGVIGDHTQGDRYPLQAQNFVKGPEIGDTLKKLVLEGGGGGDSEESYELAALFYARNCNCPNAIRKPVFIFIGDEGIHSVVTESDASNYCKTTVQGRLSPEQIFAELKAKFDVWVIRKPYCCSGNSSSPANDRIQQQWEKLLGTDHVVALPEPERVVDVIFGILGEITGKGDYFEKELRDRQGKDADGAAQDRRRSQVAPQRPQRQEVAAEAAAPGPCQVRHAAQDQGRRRCSEEHRRWWHFPP